MDVRCERCKTEYEFEDARITEAGVTVKCTTCGHVFKVKKKALVVTVPVKPGELEQAHAPLTQPPLASAPLTPSGSMERPSGEKAAAKEWKVRQANGNVFTFKELTTLQKWIVERKVARDDEISLTGESWKRLGNIAELATFFQVVEEAQKGAQLSALQSTGLLGIGGAPIPVPQGSFPPAAMPTEAAAAVQVPVAPPPTSHPGYPVAPVAPPSGSPVMVAPPGYGMVPPQGYPPQGPAVAPPGPAPARPVAAAPQAAADDDIERAAGLRKGGGAGKWLVLLGGLALLGGGGYAGYAFYWLPQEEARLEAARVEAERARKEAERQAAELKARKEEAARKEAEEKARQAAAQAAADAGVASADAGVLAQAEPPDAGTVGVTPATRKEPVRDFDWYMRQGDNLRERERAEAALDAYGKAADLEPDRAEPIAGRGLALLDMGSKLQAEAAFQQALKLNPRYGVALMGLAETYRAQGKKNEALEYYQKYLELLPNGPEAGIARGAIKRLQE